MNSFADFKQGQKYWFRYDNGTYSIIEIVEATAEICKYVLLVVFSFKNDSTSPYGFWPPSSFDLDKFNDPFTIWKNIVLFKSDEELTELLLRL